MLKAYQSLADQGLVVGHRGQGTRVTGGNLQQESTLRTAELVHRAESFLLEVLTEDYAPSEVERAVWMALDRWRVLKKDGVAGKLNHLRFIGSHDPVITMLANQVSLLAPDTSRTVSFSGSLGGLIALADGEPDLAGSHLWDEETGLYNDPFVRHFFPGSKMALVTVAHRRSGLILSCSNPKGIRGLEDLLRPDIVVINRKHGTGTRVWLDARLKAMAVSPEMIRGYDEAETHSEVALAVAEGRADAGVGIENASLNCGLEFLFLTEERYDLVLPEDVWNQGQ